MTACERYRERLIDLSCDLLDPAEAADCRAHISSCAGCGAEWARLTELMSSLTPDAIFPREAQVDWDRFARSTVKRAIAEPSGFLARLRGLVPRVGLTTTPAWAAAAALLIVVSATVILLDRRPETTMVATGPAADSVETPAAGADPDTVQMPGPNIDHLTVNLARENTARYLNETRSVLVTLLDVNIHCEKGKVDISAERAKATELLRRQRLIAAELHRLPLARAKDVCGDLERLLLEISTLADCTRDDEIQTLRDVVEKRQILVRMELLSQELARQEGARV